MKKRCSLWCGTVCVCWFFFAAITNSHKLSISTQHRFIILHFCRSEIRVGSADFPAVGLTRLIKMWLAGLFRKLCAGSASKLI